MERLCSMFLKAECFLKQGILITRRLHHFKECSLPLYYGFNDEFSEKSGSCSQKAK